MTDRRPDRPTWLAAATRRLERTPRLAVFLAALVVGLAALFTPGVVGAVLVGVLAVGVAVLVSATWARRSPAERAVRLLLVGVLVVIAASKVL